MRGSGAGVVDGLVRWSHIGGVLHVHVHVLFRFFLVLNEGFLPQQTAPLPSSNDLHESARDFILSYSPKRDTENIIDRVMKEGRLVDGLVGWPGAHIGAPRSSRPLFSTRVSSPTDRSFLLVERIRRKAGGRWSMDSFRWVIIRAFFTFAFYHLVLNEGYSPTDNSFLVVERHGRVSEGLFYSLAQMVPFPKQALADRQQLRRRPPNPLTLNNEQRQHNRNFYFKHAEATRPLTQRNGHTFALSSSTYHPAKGASHASFKHFIADLQVTAHSTANQDFRVQTTLRHRPPLASSL